MKRLFVRSPIVGNNDKYHIVSKVGEGGTSTIFAATNAAYTMVTLKVFHDAGESNAASFYRECHFLQRLAGFDLTPTFIDAFAFEGRLVLAREFVDGISVERLLQRRPNPNQWIGIFRQLCNLVQTLHDQHVLVCDLKPGNFILTNQTSDEHGPMLKLIDVGSMSDLPIDGSSITTNNLGTHGYAAPEQYSPGSHVSKRTDVYALGALLYAGLSGIDVENQAFRFTPFTQPLLKRRKLAKLQGVIARATAYEPAHRYASARELQKATVPAPEFWYHHVLDWVHELFRQSS